MPAKKPALQSGTEAQSRPSTQAIVIGSVVVFMVSLAVRVTYFHSEPITDELYHLLAAQSWMSDGTLSIAEGQYVRASLFTKAVAFVLQYSENSLDAVRLFCMIIGALLPVSVYAWTHRNIGRKEAIVASAFIALMPGAIFLSQHIRFYGLHALVFWLAATWFYELFATGKTNSRGWIAMAGAGLLLLFGIHLQVTTLVGVAGIIVWLIVVRFANVMSWLSERKGRRILVLGIVILVLLAVVTILTTKAGRDLLGVYFASAQWNSSDTPLFYHDFYRRQFGVLWGLLPLVVLVAISRERRPAVFCVTIFLVAFFAQSFGGMRSERFMFYAMPFLAVLWGVSGVAAGRWVHRLSRELAAEWRSRAVSRIGSHNIATVSVVLVSVFMLISVPAVELSAKMIFGKPQRLNGNPQYWGRYETQWSLAAPRLRSMAKKTDLLVVTQGLQALYYLGDFDVVLNATVYSDVAGNGLSETIDPRTGRRVIANEKELRVIVDCNSSGMLVAHNGAWGNDSRVPQSVTDYVDGRLQRVEVPRKWGLIVYRWDNDSLPKLQNCVAPHAFDATR